ncbi:hypothetical protein M422DRAFT_245102 [Sphaerobolus stellatus SS14]|nr:hypothetical protein M422DRAFT_245102 [Sphaerobolus stellatus SS14]
MAEEKVNTLLYEEAPEALLLEAAREARNIHFQLDQNTCLHEAGLMPEQQVRFRTDTGGSVNNPSREYGVTPIHEVHIAWQEANAPMQRQSTPALSMTAQLDGAVVNRMTEYSGIQQMVRQAIQNASHEAEPEKSFLAKAGVKMGNPPNYSGSSECNLEKFENWVVSVLQFMLRSNLLGPQVGKVQLQFLGQCLTDEAQEWFYQNVERFDQEIKHWDLESVIMGLQKWFMPTLSMNKVAVNCDTIMQGSMTVQQLHQELTKLAKQMIELQDAYSYRRRFMNVLKPDIRDQVLRKGFTTEFSSIDELVDEAVTFDNAKCYTSGYNSNHGSSYLNKAANAESSHTQHTTTQNKSKPFDNSVVVNKGGGNVRINPTYGKIPIKLGNTANKPTQSNPMRIAAKANNKVVCFNSNQPGHIRLNCLFPDKDRRVAGAKIEEVILEEDEDQIEEFDEEVPHPEEQQNWEDQPEEDDQQYRFDDDEYETKSIDNEEVCVNAVIKDSGYNDHHRLYGIRVREAETDMRVSAVVQTGGKEQPVYDH